MAQCGFCNLLIHEDLSVAKQIVNEMRQHCERVFLGIPNEFTHARLFGESQYYSGEVRARILNEVDVNDVFVLGDEFDYQSLCETFGFDALFCGSRFGRAYEGLSDFAAEKRIELHTVLPQTLSDIGTNDALKMALENLQRHQKVVLFGTGTYFDIYMKRYGKRFHPAYAVDNDTNRQGIEKEGLLIWPPEKLKEENAEDILVVI